MLTREEYIKKLSDACSAAGSLQTVFLRDEYIEDLWQHDAEQRAEIERLTKEVTEQSTAKMTFFNGMNDMREQREELRRKMDKLQADLAACQRERDQLQRDIESGFMKGAYARLYELQQKEQKLDDSRARIAELEVEVRRLTDPLGH